MRFLIPSCTIVVAGLVVLSSCLPEPPSSNQGWGQQQSQQSQSGGWGQSAAPQSSGGWGQQQQQQQQPQSGWGQAQTSQQSSGGWAQPAQQSSGGWGQSSQQSSGGWGQEQSQNNGGSGQKGQKGKGEINWGAHFALGYQGEKGQGGGHAEPGGGTVGWSSQAETNVKKPSIGDIFRSIIGIPRQIKDLFKESGLWILFLPLLVIIPLLFVAFSIGRFWGGLGGGWGWDKRSSSAKAFYAQEWESLKGFLKDPKVQRAAKGFMDEFVVKRIMTSTSEESKVTSTSVKNKSS